MEGERESDQAAAVSCTRQSPHPEHGIATELVTVTTREGGVRQAPAAGSAVRRSPPINRPPGDREHDSPPPVTRKPQPRRHMIVTSAPAARPGDPAPSSPRPGDLAGDADRSVSRSPDPSRTARRATRRPRRLHHQLHQRMHAGRAMYLDQRPLFAFPLRSSARLEINRVGVAEKRRPETGGVLPQLALRAAVRRPSGRREARGRLHRDPPSHNEFLTKRRWDWGWRRRKIA